MDLSCDFGYPVAWEHMLGIQLLFFFKHIDILLNPLTQFRSKDGTRNDFAVMK